MIIKCGKDTNIFLEKKILREDKKCIIGYNTKINKFIFQIVGNKKWTNIKNQSYVKNILIDICFTDGCYANEKKILDLINKISKKSIKRKVKKNLFTL